MKKAILVGVNVDNEENFEESMKELKGLATACDFKVEGSLTQNMKIPNKKFFIGPGKIETLKAFAEAHEADVIIFDNELNNSGLKNEIFSNTGNENNCLVVKAAKKTIALIITIQISLAIVSN